LFAFVRLDALLILPDKAGLECVIPRRTNSWFRPKDLT